MKRAKKMMKQICAAGLAAVLALTSLELPRMTVRAHAEEVGEVPLELSVLSTNTGLEIKKLTEQDGVLQSGVYYVDEDLTFTGKNSTNVNEPGGNGLRIATGAAVYIYVAEGKTLTASGGNGYQAQDSPDAPDGDIAFYPRSTVLRDGITYSYPGMQKEQKGGAGGTGATGGGAAIYVPSDTDFVLFGPGSVNAQGGNGGDGGNGSMGGMSSYAYSAIKFKESSSYDNILAKKIVNVKTGTGKYSRIITLKAVRGKARKKTVMTSNCAAYGVGGGGGGGAAGGGAAVGSNGAKGYNGSDGMDTTTVPTKEPYCDSDNKYAKSAQESGRIFIDCRISAKGGKGGSAGTQKEFVDSLEKHFTIPTVDGTGDNKSFYITSGQCGGAGAAGGDGAKIGNGGGGGSSGGGGDRGQALHFVGSSAKFPFSHQGVNGKKAGANGKEKSLSMEESQYPYGEITFKGADPSSESMKYYLTKTEKIRTPLYSPQAGQTFLGWRVTKPAAKLPEAFGASDDDSLTVTGKIIKADSDVSVSGVYGNITLEPELIDHAHIWTYETDETYKNILWMYCSDIRTEDKYCDYQKSNARPIYLDTKKGTYSPDDVYAGASVTDNTYEITGNPQLTDEDIVYYKSTGPGSLTEDGEALGGAPQEAGNYIAELTMQGATAKSAFQINPKKIAKPLAGITSFAYDQTEKTYLPENFDDEFCSISGNKAVDAGNDYVATVSLKDKNNTCWNDGSTDDLTFTYSIKQAAQSAKVEMESYHFGMTPRQPYLTGAKQNPKVTYYYYQDDGLESEKDAKAWSGNTGSSLPSGQYKMFAKLEATDDYAEYVTPTVSFQIIGEDMEDDIMAEDVTVTYDGKSHGIKVAGTLPEDAVITYGMTKGKYTKSECPLYTDVSYSGDGSVTSRTIYYKVTADAYNPLEGQAEITIRPKTITDDMVTLDREDKTYLFTGKTIAPVVTVKDAEVLLESGAAQDYVVEAPSAVEYGEHVLMVTGKNNYAGEVRISWKIDEKNAPKGTITIGNNVWDTLHTDAAWKHFFKEKKKVTIHGEDGVGESGIDKIYYYAAAKAVADVSALEQVPWAEIENNGSFEIVPDSCSIIYAKIVDKAGNLNYISSDGVVLYTDAETETKNVTYIKKTKEDQTIKVSFHNNTIKEVVNGTESLIPDVDYTLCADGEGIVLLGEYLDRLNAGNYKISIQYNPYGMEYCTDTENQEPKAATVALNVKRAKQIVVMEGNLDKEYDGKTVQAPECKDIEGIAYTEDDLTVLYKEKNLPDTSYTDTAPKDAGSYTVKVVAKADDCYEEAAATKDFEILPKKLTAAVIAENKVYDGSAFTHVQATVDTGIEGEKLTISGLTGSFADCNAGEAKEVLIDASKASVAAGENTKASNYQIFYVESTKADISRKAVIVKVNDAKKHIGEEDPEFKYQASGLVAGEELDHIKITRKAGETAGNYQITATQDNMENVNYQVSFIDGDFIIEDHIWPEEWTIVQEATVTSTGSKEKKCRYAGCTEKLQEIIPKLSNVTSGSAVQPTGIPGVFPTQHPTEKPEEKPSEYPAGTPGADSTQNPTETPEEKPSAYPTGIPSVSSTQHPTGMPGVSPTQHPMGTSTVIPEVNSTQYPTGSPGVSSTQHPMGTSTVTPEVNSTQYPTRTPEEKPSAYPTEMPEKTPGVEPTQHPIGMPEVKPSMNPIETPGVDSTQHPMETSEVKPSTHPTETPGVDSTQHPMGTPEVKPSMNPTETPGVDSTQYPTGVPVMTLGGNPSETSGIKTTQQPVGTSILDISEIERQREKTELTMNAGLKVSQAGKKIIVSWGTVKDASGYEVYVQYCGQKFNASSLHSVEGGEQNKLVIKTLNGKKLNLKKNYRVYVSAYKMENGQKIQIGKSIIAHIIGSKNTKQTNVKKVKTAKSTYQLKVGSTAVIKARTVLVDHKKKPLSNAHAKEFRYASGNKDIVSVNSKGVIRGIQKGTGVVYVYARNGYAKEVKVMVI